MSYSEIITIAEDSVIDLACSLQIQCLFHHGGDSKLIPKSDKNKKNFSKFVFRFGWSKQNRSERNIVNDV